MAGGRKPGQTDGGGRKKGTPNKKTAELIDLVNEACPGFHPIVAMAKIAHLGVIETLDIPSGKMITRLIADEHRIKCVSEVSQYLFPKRKAVEHSGGIATSGGVLLVEKVASTEEWVAQGQAARTAAASAE